MRIRLDSIGCRLNIGEIEAMSRTLAARGHSIVSQGDPADLCILNTCTVTAIASKKSRAFIRQLRRRNPGARVIATGCLAELEPDSLESLGVDLVVGNDAKDALPKILADRGWLTQDGVEPDDPPTASGARTRAFLKVQDGCDNRCTFCVVTIARGSGRSLRTDEILAEIRGLVALGYREVVLSGVHLGSYGHDLGQTRGLEQLVFAILAETDVPRLRLSSLEPWDLDPGFFRIFEDARVLPHLHLPLQSGCDATLARMARRTTVRGFADLVDAARTVDRDIAISTDVMVGFPGETDEEFASSITTVASLGFSKLHVFRYSRREGTRAATMPGQVPGPVATDRSAKMHDLGERLASEFHHRFVGRRLDVLWEDAEEIGDQRRWSGLTGNYIRVLTEAPADVDLGNTITPVDLEACVPGAVIGSIPGVSATGIAAISRRGGVSLPLRES
ncbi:MAG: tRNA (N(6)-L-threonylcarbamoyladenosine(37)-C(2))-methylthiotransferase MtaB [Candidatus Sulfomarinibacteraceae bacterium]